MDVTENNLVAIGVNEVVQGIGLPLAEHIPGWKQDLIDNIELYAPEGWFGGTRPQYSTTCR